MVIDFEFQPKKKNQKHRYLIKSQKIFLLFLTFRLSIRSIIKCFVRETEKFSQRNRQIQCESESIANSLEFHDLLAPTSSKFNLKDAGKSSISFVLRFEDFNFRSDSVFCFCKCNCQTSES